MSYEAHERKENYFKVVRHGVQARLHRLFALYVQWSVHLFFLSSRDMGELGSEDNLHNHPVPYITRCRALSFLCFVTICYDVYFSFYSLDAADVMGLIFKVCCLRPLSYYNALACLLF